MTKKHASLDLSGDVFNICEPFFQRYQLNGFSYARIYPDGSRTELWSDALALDHTFFKRKYILGAYTPNYFSEEERFAFFQLKVSAYPKIWKEKFTKQLADQRDFFNHDHSFIVVNREPSFCEYFFYYAPREAHSILNFYINNLNILDSFAANFKSTATDLITIADNHRIPMPGCSLIKSSNSFSSNCSKDLLCHSTKLSRREQEIAALMLNGKVAREVGDLLHISQRTVESHIEHMKQKANCYKKSELIEYLCNNRKQIFSENELVSS